MRNFRFFGLTIASLVLGSLPLPVQAQSTLADLNSWVEKQTAGDQATASAYFFLFLGGLLASLLPCTYPLYPITANVIRSRSGGGNNISHPLTYYAGLAGIYLVFGVVASLSGGAFNQVLRLPLTNVLIGTLIFLMGLTAAGLLYLPIFSGSGTDTQQKGLPGTFLMGLGAGLLASSCVGPVVVSVLIGLASHHSGGFSWVTTLASATKMLAFGLGLGIPFLVIGVFGVKLPKGGKWMVYVQYALAAFIVYFAYTYLEKGLLGYGLSPREINLLVLGAVVFLTAAYFYQSTAMLSFERMKRALLLLASISGVLIMLRGAWPAGPTYLTAPTSGSTPVMTTTHPVATEQEGGLTWYLDKEQAYQVAKASGKKVFIDFYANWCTNCKEFKKNTQQDEALKGALKEAVLLKIYDYAPDFEQFRQDTRFPELKVGLPFFAVTDKDGHLLYKTNDYLKTEEMALFLTE